jgi:DNA methyltransferase 1-associated protein 1
MYQSSQGLSQLLQTLLQADKSKKRRSILGPDGAVASPASQTPTQAGGPVSRGDTPSANAAAAAAAANNNNKKGPAVPPVQPVVRQLTAAEESRYGIQHHERVTAGVQFRSDRAQKLTQAKSNVQTQKLASALAELEIPVRLFMPTERVCKDFEKLIQSVNVLLEARKVSEKVESEIRVLEASKAERERKAREAAGETTATDPENPEVKTEAEDGTGVLGSTAEAAGSGGEKREGGDGENAEEAAKEDGNHKRSASVLSAVSDKSNKRQRR